MPKLAKPLTDLQPRTAKPKEKSYKLACLTLEEFDEPQLLAHLASHGVEVGEVKIRYGAGAPFI